MKPLIRCRDGRERVRSENSLKVGDGFSADKIRVREDSTISK